MVIVTDGFWQKTLAVTRALGRAGVGVAVLAESRFACAFFSRYCTRRLLCPSPARDPDAFVDFVVREASALPAYRMIVPMEDDTMALLGTHRDRLPGHLRLVAPPQASLATALDKWETTQLAARLGLIVPATYLVEDADDLDRVAGLVPFPAVIKPRRSWGARGLAFVDTPAQLRARFPSIHRHYPRPLVQERIPAEGEPLAVNLLFDRHSEPVSAVVQKSYREYPLTGGSSTLRETIDDPALLRDAITLLRALRWYGVAQVEFKRDPRDGRAKLMEINPRFWNSLQLSLDAGVNFPARLHRVALDEPLVPELGCPAGIRSRWLLPGDILHFLKNPARWSMRPSFFEFFEPSTRYEDFAADDPGGMLGVWLSLLSSLGRRDHWRLALGRRAP